MSHIIGTENDDFLQGTEDDDLIEGLAGTDNLQGGDGDDVLLGGDGQYDILVAGDGNDTLSGGAGGGSMMDGQAGADIYVFTADDGAGNQAWVGAGDRIVLEGLNPADVEITRTQYTFTITVPSTGASLYVQPYYPFTSGEEAWRLGEVEFGNGTIWGAEQLAAAPFMGAEFDDFMNGSEYADEIHGLGGNDFISGDAGNDVLDGGDGTDNLQGGDGDDVLLGGDGQYDILVAGDGSDTLSGGAGGGSMLDGQAGADTYVFTADDGSGNQAWVGAGDRIVLQGLNPADVEITRTQNTFTIMVPSTGASLYVTSYYPYEEEVWRLVEVEFGNGTIWGAEELAAVPFVGTEFDDFMNGSEYADEISGLGGNDFLQGHAGNDVLDGGDGTDNLQGGDGDDALSGGDGQYDILVAGDGNDTLSGGAGGGSMMDGQGGADTYVFSAADGAGNQASVDADDRIVLQGLDPADVQITRTQYTFTITVPSTGASLYVQTAYPLSEEAWRLVEVEFGDGTIWGAEQLAAVPFMGTEFDDFMNGSEYGDEIHGLGGNDFISGDAGNDVLDGGDGTDNLQGGDGEDALSGGDGQWDILVAGDGSDTLSGGAGGGAMMDGQGGADTYVFSAADGAGNQAWVDADDRIVLQGLNPVDVEITRTQNTFTITVPSTGASLYVTTSYPGSEEAWRLAEVEFANGTVWGAEELAAARFYGSEFDDFMNGSEYADEIFGLGGNDYIHGNDGDDYLDGGTGQDQVFGGAGDDMLLGAGFDNDQLFGGDGDDTYLLNVNGYGGQVHELADEGVDVISTSADMFFLPDNVEMLIMAGTQTMGVGNNLDNTIVGNTSANLINGGTGADLMIGGTGDDTYVVDNSGDEVVEYFNQGIDTVLSSIDYTLGDFLENLTLTGFAAIDGTGNTLNNVLTGSSQANVLTGGGGSDSMNGGAGDDTYVVDGTGDLVTENADEGIDTVTSSVHYTLGANVENLTLLEAQFIFFLNGTGNELDNVLVGSSARNTLDGSAGADTMAGGGGSDIYVVDDSGDLVIELAGGSDLLGDTVRSSISYVLGDQVENLVLLDGAISGTGNEFANNITGNAANNVLDAGGNINGGPQGMAGGLGDDVYYVHSAVEFVTENAGEGYDIVYSDSSFTIQRENVEELVMLVSGTAVGSSGDDFITGSSGSDFISGSSGNDTLDGGLGLDNLLGGGGDDRYNVTIGDAVHENAGDGIDSVYASGIEAPYTLAANVEVLHLFGGVGIGNELDNQIYAHLGAEYLDGGAGADYLFGSDGNHIYIVDNAGDVVEDGGAGDQDRVDSSVSFTLGAGLEELRLQGSADLTGTGNDGNNSLYGNDGNNLLTGGLGSDQLSGGYGVDTLIGGVGDDAYQVSEAGDVVIENAGEGHDQVMTWISYTLAANVEWLGTVGGSASINLTGNALDNHIFGNEGSNVIDGAGGADVLMGLGGDDTYLVDAGDSVYESAGGGIDAVSASFSYTLGAELENLVLTGNSAINGTGNALDNTLTGNSANNTLTGGAGNDRYVVQNAGDVVVENAGGGTDVLNTSLTTTLGANLEGLVLTGTGNINGTGNALANLVSGNSGINTLNGGAGFDALEGGGGADVLTDTSGGTYFNGGTGADSLTGGGARDFFIGGSGNDSISTGNGAEVIAFNLGDGRDTINPSSGIDNTLSLGGSGITYSGLTFQKVGKDLVLNVSGGDSITFKNWYQGGNNETVLTLQVVTEVMDGYDPGSSNALLDDKIEAFDFQGLVDAFDAARAANPSITTWALDNALAQEHLWGSDNQAFGSSLAYHYGLDGTLAGFEFDAAQNVMTASNYGTQPQLFLIGDPFDDGLMLLS